MGERGLSYGSGDSSSSRACDLPGGTPTAKGGLGRVHVGQPQAPGRVPARAGHGAALLLRDSAGHSPGCSTRSCVGKQRMFSVL